MLEHPLVRLDLGRYQRWIRRMAGRDCPLRAFDAEGVALPGPADALDGEIAQGLRAAPDADATAVRRLDLGDGQIVLFHAVTAGDGEMLGWLALVAGGAEVDGAALELDQLAEAFGDLMDAVIGELRSARDLDQLAQELGECYEELHLVYAVDVHVKGRAGLDLDVLQGLLESTAAHMGADVAAFVLPEQRLCVHAIRLSREIHNLDLVLVEMRGDLFRFVQSSRESMVLNDASDARRPYVFTDMPYRVLASPVDIDGSVGGIVVLLNHMEKAPFTNSDLHLMEVLANQLSSLARGQQLIHGMRDFTKQMAEALVEAVEAKDPYTRGHSERVNFFSMEIGRAMGLPASELEDLHWGSLLHDVGKIGIPDAVLCKPGRLTKDEYTFIKVHPERSYEILRNVAQLRNALPGLRHHQEMYDGNGYPHGLRGERIPLHARIMAVADTYDSITSSRAYRPGRSHETAMAEIERVTGTQLDPAIVAIFKRICASEPAWLAHLNIRREKAA